MDACRPRLEGACYNYPTSCSLPTNPAFHESHTQISTHLPILLLSLGWRIMPLYGLSTEVWK